MLDIKHIENGVLTSNNEITMINGWKKENGEEAVKTLLNAHRLPEILIAGNDMIAIGILQQIQYEKMSNSKRC